MLMTEPTEEQLMQWKQIYAEHRPGMQSNRKTGAEVDAYLRKNYHCQRFDDQDFTEVVVYNIVENEHPRRKLPEGMLPDISSYRIGDVLVGIDLVSGEFHVESTDLEQAERIYDDLFTFRGLDEEDLKNVFLTAQYVMLGKRNVPVQSINGSW